VVPVPSDWREVVRAAVRRVYGDALRSLDGADLEEEENLFFRALVGKYGNAYARLERTLVTLAGNRAHEFFRPFFSDVRDLEKPFDFEGELRGRVYQVKVVVGPKAFNSSVRRTVEEASLRYGNPVILTLQGGYFVPERVGRALWLSAPASWRMVTGEPGAYRAFRDLVFEEARNWRNRANTLIGASSQSKVVTRSG